MEVNSLLQLRRTRRVLQAISVDSDCVIVDDAMENDIIMHETIKDDIENPALRKVKILKVQTKLFCVVTIIVTIGKFSIL